MEYALTLKFNPIIEDYGQLVDLYRHSLTYLRDKYKATYSYLVEEFDSKGKLHLHGFITLPKKVRYCEIRMPCFSLLLKTITSKTGWMNYCNGSKGLDKKKKKKADNKHWQAEGPFGPGFYRQFENKPYDHEIVAALLEVEQKKEWATLVAQWKDFSPSQ